MSPSTWMLWPWPRPEEAASAPTQQAQREAWAWGCTVFSPEVFVLDVGLALHAAPVARYWASVSGGVSAADGCRALWTRVQAHLSGLADWGEAAGGESLWQARARAVAGASARVAVDDLPLWALPGVDKHLKTWAALGMQRWGDVRRLPRGSVARRWGASVLQTLDEAYGERTPAVVPVVVPEHLDLRLALTPVDRVDGLVQPVQQLLAHMGGWLRARQQWAQTLTWTLHLDVPQLQVQQGRVPQQAFDIHSAEASSDVGLWSRLMQEHMTRWTLTAPVIELQLAVTRAQAADDANRGLWDGPRGVSLEVWLDRVKARWGGQGVLMPQLCAERVPERMQHWHADLPTQTQPAAPVADEAWLFPPWLLQEPLPLWVQNDRPCYQGPLRLVLGPQRLDALPWANEWAQAPRAQRREYFIARSAQAGWLWVFREHTRPDDPTPRWFLHGVYG